LERLRRLRAARTSNSRARRTDAAFTRLRPDGTPATIISDLTTPLLDPERLLGVPSQREISIPGRASSQSTFQLNLSRGVLSESFVDQ